ncbi:MAG: T9SS C-terminal target domain-containing protein [Chlorobi bacterium CHB7]|nr:T9SS C-terminal target domain-containing protein [Chlorobi bacterium CHB7]
MTGKEVSVLTNEVLKPGSYEVGFNASHLSSGVYYYRIEAGEFVSVKRMVLLK